MRRSANPAIPLLMPKHVTDGVWQAAIHQLSASFLEGGRAGEFDRVMCNYAYLCFGEVIRLKWDSKFQLKVPVKVKGQVKAAGELLYRLLDLCIDLWALTPGGYSHPAYLFCDLIAEWEAWGQIRHTEGKVTFTEVRRQLQSENRKLTNCENPFSGPKTKAFFDVVIQAAERNGRFMTQKYRPYVNARKSLVAAIPKGESIVATRTESGKAELSQVRSKRAKERAA